MKVKTLRVSLLIVAMMLLTACPKNDPVSVDPDFNVTGTSTSSFKATFTEQTIYFDSTELSDIVSIDSVNYIFEFKKSSVKANELEKDKILLIYGLALRKVVGVNKSGNTIVVETGEAALNDAIEDGEMEWNSYCNFDPASASNMQMKVGKETFYPTFQGNDEISFKFKYGDIDYSLTMKLENTSAYCKFSASKTLGGAIKGKFETEGRISAFNSANKIVIKKRELQDFQHNNNDMKGDLTLSLSAAGSGNAKIDFTPTIFSLVYPMMVGPIPIFIRLKMQFVINAVVPLDASALLSINFKYDSRTGFTYDKNQFSGNNLWDALKVTANAGQYRITNNKNQGGSSTAMAANYGIGFPRIEVGIGPPGTPFEDILVPWIQTAFLIGHDFTVHPLCMRTQASFIGGMGYDFKLFKIKQSGSKNLWKLDTLIHKTGECP